MKARVPNWRRRFFPLGDWHRVTPQQVQERMRGVFAVWGLPLWLRVDGGYPWGPHPDMPPDRALWWVGLGIGVTWNRPCHPQENGKVERSHGVSGAWAEPQRCRNAAELQERLCWASRLQREKYPAVKGQSRWAAHPELAAGGRAYDPAEEEARWDLGRVCQFLAQWVWRRVVDKAGKISIYNRPYTVGKRRSGEGVNVRFDAQERAWVILTDRGEELRRYPAEQITKERILALEVSHRKHSQRAREEVQLPIAA
jgi:hypothetical protein